MSTGSPGTTEQPAVGELVVITSTVEAQAVGETAIAFGLCEGPTISIGTPRGKVEDDEFAIGALTGATDELGATLRCCGWRKWVEDPFLAARFSRSLICNGLSASRQPFEVVEQPRGLGADGSEPGAWGVGFIVIERERSTRGGDSTANFVDEGLNMTGRAIECISKTSGVWWS
ncbi:hypothetical protein HYDPIDRAFT_171149 [Hydnomerulius pinastri MD-312]|uniref:Unplaced genomic scaffold scaffold_78, whole genome shotgun sequence n=1 Tax=Hydnomerulius pinastri MD-312 TaxID=994086 RepID=A0A0C9W7C9_9AGAM|nr:hypothetical protein HYDPIDRAFT_171149 [Hydnomerulius pinastri MD-312]